MVLDQSWLPAKNAFLFDRLGVMDDNTLLDTGLDPWSDNGWNILRTVCFLFISFFSRARREKGLYYLDAYILILISQNGRHF